MKQEDLMEERQRMSESLHLRRLFGVCGWQQRLMIQELQSVNCEGVSLDDCSFISWILHTS